MFGPTSRYNGLPTTTIERADGTRIVYVRRRFVPPAERFELLLEHTVAEGERLDHLAARYLGDPEQYWRIADANAAMQPDDLAAKPGERVRITLPEGVVGARSF